MRQNFWNFWWWKKCLLDLHQHPYWTQYLFFPTGVSLVFYTHSAFNMLLALPVTVLLGPAAAYNFCVLFALTLAGWGAYLLVRELTGDSRAGILAGLVFTIPHKMAAAGLVDGLGGITIEFEHPARDTESGLFVTETGPVELDGEQALAYVRSRHYEELIDGQWVEDPTADLGRMERQRTFLTHVIGKLSDTRNPFTLAGVAACGDDDDDGDTDVDETVEDVTDDVEDTVEDIGDDVEDEVDDLDDDNDDDNDDG